jgi:prophage antirepressor-like protein
MKALQQFQFEQFQLRIEVDDHGEPLFHAGDLCTILGYSNPWDAVSRHVDQDDLVKREALTEGGKQMVNFIREPGMWSLIMSSKAPNAKPVKRWVVAEVLPSIRKTGGYIAEASYAQKLLDTKDQLLASQQAQLGFLQTELEKSQNITQGMTQMFYESEAKANRLQRARGKVSLVERKAILEKHREGWDVPAIARWSFRSRDMVKRIVESDRGEWL